MSPMDSQLAGPNLTNGPLASSWTSHDCLELLYVLIDLSVVHKKSVYSSVIKTVFGSVDNLISTSCCLTEKWRVQIFVGYQFLVKYALFDLSTSIRAGIAVQGLLVQI